MTGNFKLAVFGCDAQEERLFGALANGYGFDVYISHECINDQNAKFAQGCICVSVNHKASVSKPVLAGLKKAGVQYVSTRSIGCNHIDTEYAKTLGIGTGGIQYSPGSVADYTLMLILMSLRRAKPVIAKGLSHDYRLEKQRGRELGGLCVGVVGAGRIGGQVIRRLCGFGCKVLVYDAYPGNGKSNCSLEELFKSCDIVTLHVPLDEGTRHLVDAKRLACMKKGAVLINTGRGGLVDTHALVQALESGRLAGAALDVLEGEEGIFYHLNEQKAREHKYLARLQEMPQVIITPHMAYHTYSALADTVECTLENCRNFVEKLQSCAVNQ